MVLKNDILMRLPCGGGAASAVRLVALARLKSHLRMGVIAFHYSFQAKPIASCSNAFVGRNYYSNARLKPHFVRSQRTTNSVVKVHAGVCYKPRS